jgi:hypothetical protein
MYLEHWQEGFKIVMKILQSNAFSRMKFLLSVSLRRHLEENFDSYFRHYGIRNLKNFGARIENKKMWKIYNMKK